jgi:hypothetical protein
MWNLAIQIIYQYADITALLPCWEHSLYLAEQPSTNHVETVMYSSRLIELPNRSGKSSTNYNLLEAAVINTVYLELLSAVRKRKRANSSSSSGRQHSSSCSRTMPFDLIVRL